MGLTKPAKVVFFSFFLLVLILLALSISLVAVIDIRGVTKEKESAAKTVRGGNVCLCVCMHINVL